MAAADCQHRPALTGKPLTVTLYICYTIFLSTLLIAYIKYLQLFHKAKAKDSTQRRYSAPLSPGDSPTASDFYIIEILIVFLIRSNKDTRSRR